MSPKTKKIIGNVVFVLLIGLLIWPTSRSYFQQFLMKMGFFKPKLELNSASKDSDRVASGGAFSHARRPGAALE
jgi:hypothetical protein